MSPESSAGTAPFYTWKPADKAVSVQIQFDIVDRILLEVMKGFGSVPKRGAEVGGILLGTTERNKLGELLVKIEDFEPVNCDHAQGPSYVLSESDRDAFDEACERWQRGPDRRIYAVGYYRGHTRDGVCLAAEDLALLEDQFPGDEAIALVVKPYATKVSTAGIFFREEGKFKADSTYLEFPFSRKELGGGSSGSERLTSAARFGQQRVYDEPLFASPPQPQPQPQVLESAPPTAPTFGIAADPPKKGKGVRGGWVWIPLSFIFMLLGTVIGFQIALSMRPKQPANPWIEAWDMALTVKQNNAELLVSWDPLAPAIRNSNRGVLYIQTRTDTHNVEMKGSQLQAGSVIYRSVPERAVFRLEVFPRERATVSETAEFKTETK
ncbi:MAG: hypothetical protein FJW38_09975 [Acidobacteria bacterium]|nr:hypothetical protein [Acidobacteriota bacterium]